MQHASGVRAVLSTARKARPGVLLDPRESNRLNEGSDVQHHDRWEDVALPENHAGLQIGGASVAPFARALDAARHGCPRILFGLERML